VNVLATFPEFRGLGIGTALLEIAESNGSEAGAPALSVIVGSWNDAAIRLYDRAGYEAVASEPAIPFPGCRREGEWVLMVKPLTNANDGDGEPQ
jgi:GNAT superfamily N-acetyltransferase